MVLFTLSVRSKYIRFTVAEAEDLCTQSFGWTTSRKSSCSTLSWSFVIWTMIAKSVSCVWCYSEHHAQDLSLSLKVYIILHNHTVHQLVHTARLLQPFISTSLNIKKFFI